MRSKVFLLILICLFLFPLFGLIKLQVVRGNSYYNLSRKNYIRLIEQKSPRGIITDRNGEILVKNRLAYNIAIIPQEFKEKDSTFNILSKLLDVEEETLNKNFKKNYYAPFAPILIKKNITKKQAMMIEQKKTALPGIIIETFPERSYLHGKICSHILGYLGLVSKSKISKLKEYGYSVKDLVGHTGVEEFFDRFLKGKDGGTQIKADNRGRQVEVLAMRSPEKGKDVAITIDLRIQKIAAKTLGNKKGAIVIIQPYSGEILAMVSSPSYDPNIFTAANSENRIKNLFKDKRSPMLNRCISGLYPPGSIFKIVIATASLEEDKTSPYTSFTCNGNFRIGNASFRCSRNHGIQELRDAITHSCNTYFYNLGLILGPELIEKYALDWGFGKLTGIDLPFEQKGNVPSKIKKRLFKNERWYKGNTINFSIGQGEFLATPLQAARLMAAIANGGWLIEPFLLLSINGAQVVRKDSAKKIAVKNETLETIRSALRNVVSDPSGTAHIVNISGFPVAGKTGTAQASRGKSHSWFAGYGPTKKPEIAFCVFLEHGGSSYNACVLAKKILEEVKKLDLKN